MVITKVFQYGCRAPRDDIQETRAIQLLGQAANYADDLRRAYNVDRRDLSHKREDAHVIVWSRQPERREDRNARIRAARAARGALVDWGTYSLVEEAVLQSAKRTAVGDRLRAHPRVWDGQGRIGAFVSSSNKPKVEQDGSVHHGRITMTAPDAKGYALLAVVVGPAKTGTRIVWPIKVHRPLPVGATIDRVAVQRVRNGWRYRWEALFTVTYESAQTPRPSGVATMMLSTIPGTGHVADVLLPDGRTFAITHDVADSMRYSDSVRSTRDQHFDIAKALASERYRTEQQHPEMWRDKSRLARLALRENDADLEWWRYRDRHLEDIESGVRQRSERRRLDAYRVAAARIAAACSVLVLEDIRPTLATRGENREANYDALGELHCTLADKTSLCWMPPEYTSLTDLRDAGENWIAEQGTVRARTSKPVKRKAEPYQAPNAGTEHGYEVEGARKPLANAAE